MMLPGSPCNSLFLNPNFSELIPLDWIDDVRISLDKWFQRDDCFYVYISYSNKEMYFVLQQQEIAHCWVEYIRQAIGYHKYIKGKIEGYMSQNENEKAFKRAIHVMLQLQNKEIELKDDK